MNENILDGLSMNLEQANMDKLKSVFPECFAESKLDIDKLLSLCGEYIDNDFEKYKFEWKGKAECLRLAQKRSTGTLRPCPEESVNWDTTKNLYIEGDNLEVLKLLQTAYYRKVKMIYIVNWTKKVIKFKSTLNKNHICKNNIFLFNPLASDHLGFAVAARSKYNLTLLPQQSQDTMIRQGLSSRKRLRRM